MGQLSHMRLSAPTQLQDFAAHSETVNCLQLGRKSAQVLVTGGDDARVNMWAVGKPNPIISLEGHASAVECVSFDWNEELQGNADARRASRRLSGSGFSSIW